VLKMGINNYSNEEYHADRTYLSSSGIKLAYQDIAEFNRQYNLNQKKEFSNIGALDEGSYAHTLILEPELVNIEYAFFPGWQKRGSDYESFVSANQGKKILSATQKNRIDQLFAAYKKHPIAPTLISGGEAEQSICTEISGHRVKARFDYVNVEKGEIYDVKTTGYAGDVDSFKMTIDQLCYQLSGALYCQVAESFYGKPFSFFFIVLSKKDFTCNVYKLGPQKMSTGHRMVLEGLNKIKVARETGIWHETESARTEHESILEV